MTASPPRLACIVSGGQSGVDRAGLDVAIAFGLAYGGWCPAGGWAEDYPDPPGLLRDYPALRETPSADPEVRTRWNVRDSHATLVLRGPQTRSAGTALTETLAASLGRPVLVTDGDVSTVVRWLRGLGLELTLNVAGSRESEDPGSYAQAVAVLSDVLRVV